MPGLIDEIYEQPAALHRTLDAIGPELAALAPYAAKLKDGSFRRILFTGMGGSYHPASPSIIYLLEHGIDATMMEASELLYHYKPLLDEKTLVVMSSQSGKSVEVVKLIEMLQAMPKRPTIIGITNYPDSPVGKLSDKQVYIRAGEELTVSSKTTTCTVLALHLVTRALLGEDIPAEIAKLRRVADVVGTMLPTWNARAEALAAKLKDARFLLYLGRGPSRASANNTALISKETTKLPTEGMLGGQFRHGPMEILSRPEGIVILVYMPPGRTRFLDQALITDAAASGTQVIVIGKPDQPVPNVEVIDIPAEALDEYTAPIIEIIPAQLFAARLAGQRGLEIGKFYYGQKVTTTE